MIRIELPWPPRVLHPNSRVHWAQRARAAKAMRQAAAYCTLAAGIRRNDPDIPQAIKATITFYPPNRHKHDVDGCLSAAKSLIDGVAEVIGVDDSKWKIVPLKADPIKGGVVKIELESGE